MSRAIDALKRTFSNVLESVDSGWRHVRQCAAGAFRRVIALPVAVRADEATATCRAGVLRVALPRLTPGAPRAWRPHIE